MTHPRTSKSITSIFRGRLFKTSRPLVRRHEPKDNGFLWAAYQRESFQIPEGLGQTEFLEEMNRLFGSFALLWMVEDDNLGFKAGRGPVAIVGLQTDGWQIEPRGHFFPWATPKNKLRSLVAFFQMIRYQKDVGVCRVECMESDARMLFRMKKYGVLYPRGRIPNGNISGDLFIFSIAGKKGMVASERRPDENHTVSNCSDRS